MERKFLLVMAIVLPIFTVFNCMLLNLTPFFAGGEASFKNFIVTLIYYIVWIAIVFISYKIKSTLITRLYLIFWLVTLAISLVVIYVNITRAVADWAILTAIVVLTPTFGVGYIVENVLAITIVTAVLSVLMLIYLTLIHLKIKKSAN